MNIRTARSCDAERLLEIYTPIVNHSTVSFELLPPTIEEFAERINAALLSYEWLVAENSEILLGYAYATPHRSREAYQYTAETSVYVCAQAQGKGIGTSLYEKLLARLTTLGFHLAVAGIALPNNGSIALHKKLGFEEVGVFKEIGYKKNAWHNVSWWQRSLA